MSVWRHLVEKMPGVIGLKDGMALSLGSTATLPACESRREGEERLVRGTAGVATRRVLCRKAASDAYAWAETSGGTVTVGPWFIDDLAGSTADQEGQFGYFNTASAVSLGGSGFDYFYLPSSGVVVGAILNSDALRTAGTATLRLDKNATPQDFAAGACVLNATNTNRISVYVPAAGVSVVAMDAIKPRITTASWTPTTANVTMWLIVQLTG